MKVFIGGKSLTQFHDPGQCELSDPTVVTENSDKKKGNPVKILTWIFQSDFGQIPVRFWSENALFIYARANQKLHSHHFQVKITISVATVESINLSLISFLAKKFSQIFFTPTFLNAISYPIH